MIEILVDADEFWRRLEQDVSGARHSVVLQTLSFEGDIAGGRLAEALAAARCADRRIVIDSFTRYMLSGRFRYSPARLVDRAFRDELESTDAMIGRLRASGVGIRFCNPVGALLRRLPARNHKKSVVIDGRIAYVGGINFSDHNFEWHDLMLRIEDARLARVLMEDFEDTWAGRAVRRYGESDGLELHVLDGRTNGLGFDRLFQLVEAAERSIVVESPYLSFPFCEPLRRAARRGVELTVITPALNTIDSLKRYILWQGRRSGFRVRLYPRMSHLKAMLIDGRWLIVGSSNFDYLSYRRHQEILLIVRDRTAIETFRRRVLEPDLALSAPAEHPGWRRGGHAWSAALRGVGAAAALVSRT